MKGGAPKKTLKTRTLKLKSNHFCHIDRLSQELWLHQDNALKDLGLTKPVQRKAQCYNITRCNCLFRHILILFLQIWAHYENI